MIEFDHIAIGCRTLAEGAAYVFEKTGLKIPVGGTHPLMGTHNLLMATGSDSFLEIIAIDPSAPKPAHNRWFGLDNVDFPVPRPHAWILRSNDLDHDLGIAKDIGIDFGTALSVTRGDMTWRFAVRKDGAIPLDGAAPMIMEWPEMPVHPAEKMVDLGTRIKNITLETPHAESINMLLNTLSHKKIPVDIRTAQTPRLSVTLVQRDGRETALD
ncbi:MAG: VOC family protein [Paracoccaceae bacterium]